MNKRIVAWAWSVAAFVGWPALNTVAEAQTIPPEPPQGFRAVSFTRHTVTLAWIAPAAYDGDGGVGPVEPTFVIRECASYDLRYSNSPIDQSTWDSATQVTDLPVPTDPGTSQQFKVTDLNSNRLYYFAMKATDFSSAVSALSDIAFATTETDLNPPEQITGLRVTGATTTSISLTWKAPADDAGSVDNGRRVAGYDLRYSLTPIVDVATWAAATPVSGEPAPGPPAADESMTVRGLDTNETTGVTYYFAIAAFDFQYPIPTNVGPRSATIGGSTNPDLRSSGGSRAGAGCAASGGSPGWLLMAAGWALLFRGLKRS